MLHRFKLLLKRFQRDERGAFLVLFGVMALVLIATSGAVVDYTQIEQARSRAQNALDAAALGLQPHVFDDPARTKDWFITEAKALLAERLAADTGVTSTINDATFDKTNGQLILKAEITVSTAFVSLVGVPSVTASLISEATRKRLNIEVAMVLDNSGSMLSYERMVKLKEAAKSATDILFDYEATQPNVFVSIVPFTQYVNVGTANRTATWMSQTGASSISHLNFDDDDDESTAFTQTVSRWDLYDGFDNESWSGCVEARVAPYDADDTVPDNAMPDTMFQPVFAPDSPVDNYISDTPLACQKTRSCKRERAYYGCNKWGNDCDGSNSTYTATYPNGTVESSSSSSTCSCSDETTSDTTGSVYNISGSNYGKLRTYLCTDRYDIPLSEREYQERLCKYDGASFSGDGPNSDCPNTVILPLNNTRQTVKDRIDAMVADGSTNIEQGTVWGFHALSPTQPLTEGRAYDEATTKVMIVMTDGDNNINYDSYWSNRYGVSSYMAWGYRKDKRLLTESTTPKDSGASSTQVIGEVNRRTELACTNAKAQGIEVYTIGLAVSTTNKTMLENCASPNTTINGEVVDYSHFPNTSAELVTVFEKIAGQLSELRLAQ